jgi:hypothetical protein
MDERKGHYSPAQLGAYLKVQLLAGRQSRRGRFRSSAALRSMLPAAYARHVDFLISEGDLVECKDGLYVDGLGRVAGGRRNSPRADGALA